MATTTISGDFISHVRLMYEMGLQQIISANVYRRGINGYTSHALHSYIISVAAVESFVNEIFLGHCGRIFWKNSPLWKLPVDWIEKIELSKKLILVPELLFGESPNPDNQPFQDMAMLIRVRNDLVHYKMKGQPPKYLKVLDNRKISLVAKNSQVADFAWPHKLSTTEGIRWAHNSACIIVNEIHNKVKDKNHHEFIKSLAANFQIINDSYPREWFDKNNVDPDSNHPEDK